MKKRTAARSTAQRSQFGLSSWPQLHPPASLKERYQASRRQSWLQRKRGLAEAVHTRHDTNRASPPIQAVAPLSAKRSRRLLPPQPKERGWPPGQSPPSTRTIVLPASRRSAPSRTRDRTPILRRSCRQDSCVERLSPSPAMTSPDSKTGSVNRLASPQRSPHGQERQLRSSLKAAE